MTRCAEKIDLSPHREVTSRTSCDLGCEVTCSDLGRDVEYLYDGQCQWDRVPFHAGRRRRVSDRPE